MAAPSGCGTNRDKERQTGVASFGLKFTTLVLPGVGFSPAPLGLNYFFSSFPPWFDAGPGGRLRQRRPVLS